jgi:hypothetical protein
MTEFESLIRQLEDRSGFYLQRREAVGRLGALGDPKAVPHLLEALSDPEPYVRREAATALGRLHDPRAIPRLGALATDSEDECLRRSAVEALGEIGAPAARTPLEAALNDRALGVRWAAEAALRRLSSEQAQEAAQSQEAEQSQETAQSQEAAQARAIQIRGFIDVCRSALESRQADQHRIAQSQEAAPAPSSAPAAAPPPPNPSGSRARSQPTTAPSPAQAAPAAPAPQATRPAPPPPEAKPSAAPPEPSASSPHPSWSQPTHSWPPEDPFQIPIRRVGPGTAPGPEQQEPVIHYVRSVGKAWRIPVEHPGSRQPSAVRPANRPAASGMTCGLAALALFALAFGGAVLILVGIANSRPMLVPGDRILAQLERPEVSEGLPPPITAPRGAPIALQPLLGRWRNPGAQPGHPARVEVSHQNGSPRVRVWLRTAAGGEAPAGDLVTVLHRQEQPGPAEPAAHLVATQDLPDRITHLRIDSIWEGQLRVQGHEHPPGRPEERREATYFFVRD